MPGVPNTFANASGSIPLSQLDANFNTTLTIGTTSVGLGNTISTISNVAISTGSVNGSPVGNVTPSSGAFTTLSATGNVTVTGRVSYSASALGTYQWDSFNPTDVAGTSTNAPSTGTTVDTDYITLANSSGTVTCTFDIAGKYLIACNGQTAHSSAYSADRITWTLGGTATRYVVANPSNSGDSANDYNMAIAVVFSVTATAAQTLTVLPKYEVVGSGTTANHQCSPQLYVTYLGG